METEQNKIAEKDAEPWKAEPWKFYREVTAFEEAVIAETIRRPGLTREKCLMEIEAAGF